jgi:hypothetical protein
LRSAIARHRADAVTSEPKPVNKSFVSAMLKPARFANSMTASVLNTLESYCL